MHKLWVFVIIISIALGLLFVTVHQSVYKISEKFALEYVKKNPPYLFAGVGGSWGYNKMETFYLGLRYTQPMGSVLEARLIFLEQLLDLFESIKRDKKLLACFVDHPISIKNIQLSIHISDKDYANLNDSLFSTIFWREYYGEYKINYQVKDFAIYRKDLHEETLEEAIERSGDPKFRRLLIAEETIENPEGKRFYK